MNEIAIRETTPDLVAVSQQLKKISPKSRQTYGYYMQSFQNYCKNKGIEANFDSITDWLETFESSNSKMVALASVKAILKQFYKHDPRLLMLKTELEEIKPVKKYRAVTRSQYLTKKEIDEMLKLSPVWIRLIIESFFWTALRCSELLKVKLKDCVFIDGVYEIRTIGKGQKEQVCFLNKKLFERCRKHFNGSTYLFEHNGKPYSREYITREIKKAGNKIGKNISAHVLRHSAACYMRDEKKLSIDKIQRALNHSSMNTTSGFYLHGAPTAAERGIVSEKAKKKTVKKKKK